MGFLALAFRIALQFLEDSDIPADQARNKEVSPKQGVSPKQEVSPKQGSQLEGLVNYSHCWTY
jgi:hypothetical protein